MSQRSKIIPAHDIPIEVREAFGPFVTWLVGLVVETTKAQMKPSDAPRYYDATNAPMGKTAFLRLASEGAFATFKVGKKIRARSEDVHAYMESQNGAKPRAPRTPAQAPPVDVNALSPAELHDLEMRQAQSAK